MRGVQGRRSIAAIVGIGLVLLIAGGLVAGMIFAHIAGRTTAEPPGR
jgi:hypothetical protein